VYLRRLFASPMGIDLRVMVIGANRQPALAVYAPAEDGHVPFAIKVLTIQDGLIVAITGFVHVGLFERFGLPPRLRASN
jgi:predicted cobalt transporter CbtA